MSPVPGHMLGPQTRRRGPAHGAELPPPRTVTSDSTEGTPELVARPRRNLAKEGRESPADRGAQLETARQHVLPVGTGGDRRRWHQHTEGLGSQAQESALNLETAGSAYGWEVSGSHLSFNPERSLTPPAGGAVSESEAAGPGREGPPLGLSGFYLHCLRAAQK